MRNVVYPKDPHPIPTRDSAIQVNTLRLLAVLESIPDARFTDPIRGVRIALRSFEPRVLRDDKEALCVFVLPLPPDAIGISFSVAFVPGAGRDRLLGEAPCGRDRR